MNIFDVIAGYMCLLAILLFCGGFYSIPDSPAKRRLDRIRNGE